MSRYERTLVAFIYTALVHSTCVYCLDKDKFSVNLREAAENILGIAEFQVRTTIGHLRKSAPMYMYKILPRWVNSSLSLLHHCSFVYYNQDCATKAANKTCIHIHVWCHYCIWEAEYRISCIQSYTALFTLFTLHYLLTVKRANHLGLFCCFIVFTDRVNFPLQTRQIFTLTMEHV